MTILARETASRPLCILRSAYFALALMGGVAMSMPAGAVGPDTLKPVRICPSDPKAQCLEEPSPDTPVPDWARNSYAMWLDMKARAHGGTSHTVADMPDWSGYWSRIGALDKFDPDQPGPVSEDKITAALTPEAAATYKRKLAQLAQGIEWDPLSACLPYGYPRFVTGGFQRELIPTPTETWTIIEPDSEVRRVYTDGRGHIPEDEAYPMWQGDAIGFWDGDTLVVHTLYVKQNVFERGQPDYSDKTSAVERLRRDGSDSMVSEIWVWDPLTLTKPWHVVNHYKRVLGRDNRIDLAPCTENLNTAETPEGGTHLILPGEPGYVDPDKLTQDPAAQAAGSPSAGP